MEPNAPRDSPATPLAAATVAPPSANSEHHGTTSNTTGQSAAAAAASSPPNNNQGAAIGHRTAQAMRDRAAKDQAMNMPNAPTRRLPGAYNDTGLGLERTLPVNLELVGHVGTADTTDINDEVVGEEPPPPPLSFVVQEAAVTVAPNTDSETNHHKPLMTKYGIIGGILLVLLIIVAVVVGVVVGDQPKNPAFPTTTELQDADTTTTVDLSTARSREQWLNELLDTSWLLPETMDAIVAGDTASSAYQALEWLAQEDELWHQRPEPQRRQRFAMAAIWYATNGHRWFARYSPTELQDVEEWMSYELEECQWFTSQQPADTCDCAELEVVCLLRTLALFRRTHDHDDDNSTEVLVPMPYLRGTIPPELRLLTMLDTIDLEHQQLHGSLPLADMLEDMPRLKTVNVGHNEFTGPLEFGASQKYDRLETLVVGPNPGVAPGDLHLNLARFPQLQTLELPQTHRTGTIPRLSGRMMSLQQLNLASNELTGPLPGHVLGGMMETWPSQKLQPGLVALTSLNLADNRLTSTIPSQNVWGLANGLAHLDLSNNKLFGSIPSEIGLATALQNLTLTGNEQLNSTLPLELWTQLAALETLWVDRTSLSGSLPTALGLWTSGRSLDISSNPNMNSTIPSEIGQLTHLEEFLASNAGIRSTIPSELGLATSLQVLDLSRNTMSGMIPSELLALPSLRVLHLEGNANLSGSIPDEFCDQLDDIWLGCQGEDGWKDAYQTRLCGCHCPC